MCGLEDLEIGESTKKAMSRMIKKEQHKATLMEMRSFFLASAEHLQKNLPLRNELLKDLQCMNRSARVSAESEAAIRRIALALPHVVCDVEISMVTDE